MDIMMLCQQCERLGIKTSLLNDEMGFDQEDPGFLHYVPEADAIVSVGNMEAKISLPAMEKIIGGTKIMNVGLDASGPLPLTMRYLYGATNMMGASRLAGVSY